MINWYWQRLSDQALELSNMGIFTQLQENLAKYPQTEWQTILDKLKPSFGNQITIVPLTKLNVTKNEMNQLRQGKLISQSKKTIFYFMEFDSVTFALKRIGDSAYVFKLEQGITLHDMASKNLSWISNLIALQLKAIPRKEWPVKIEQLQKIYGIPLQLIPQGSKNLPENIRSQLQSEKIALSKPTKDRQIEITYLVLPDSDYILKVGPIKSLFFTLETLYIIITVVSSIILFFLLLLTFMFSRNLDKIYQITEQYGRGQFTRKTTISRHSSLRPLYQNIINMGNRIQELIHSHQVLSGFIAHECKTPMSRIHFTLEKMNKEKLSQNASQYIESIAGDVEDLNNLVSQFLTFFRISQHSLIIMPEMLNVTQWIKSILIKYSSMTHQINLELIVNIDHETQIALDPKYMQSVITNLLDNALRYARSKIAIQLTIIDDFFVISIDDDGIRIPEHEKTFIFQPFSQTKSSSVTSTMIGYGLGLSIARAIVALHQGTITVSDSHLGGSCFSIKLPLSSNILSKN